MHDVIIAACDAGEVLEGKTAMRKQIGKGLLMGLLLLLCMGIAAAQGTGREETELKAILSDASGNANILLFNCGDYDGDGVQEAFALTGRKTDWAYSGSIWFVSRNLTEKVHEGSYYSLQMKGEEGAMVCTTEEGYGGSGSKSHIWVVNDGRPVKVDATIAGGLSYGGGNKFYAFPSAFDGWTDGTGHTWKRYYYYLDGSELKEYGGIYIELEQLLMFDGADEIIAWVKKEGYQILNIIYRANGIINVNLRSGRQNSHLTLQYDASTVIDLDKNYGGTYALANTPQQATYPARFEEPQSGKKAEQVQNFAQQAAAAQLSVYKQYDLPIRSKVMLCARDGAGNRIGEIKLFTVSEKGEWADSSRDIWVYRLKDGYFYVETYNAYFSAARNYMLLSLTEDGFKIEKHMCNPGYSDGIGLRNEKTDEGCHGYGDEIYDTMQKMLNDEFAGHGLQFSATTAESIDGELIVHEDENTLKFAEDRDTPYEAAMAGEVGRIKDFRVDYFGEAAIGIIKYSGSTENLILPDVDTMTAQVSGMTMELKAENICSEAFKNNDYLRTLVIPEGYTTIHSNAFSGCMELTTIVLPSTLTTISSKAFAYCSELRYIIFPNGSSLHYLADDAFKGCSELEMTQEQLKALVVPTEQEIKDAAFNVDESAIIEYAGYLGRDLKEFAAISGAKKWMESDFMGYSIDGVTASVSANTDWQYIYDIQLYGKSNSSLCGIYVSMDHQRARQIMKDKGWHIEEEWTERYNNRAKHIEFQDADGNILDVTYDDSGKINRVLLTMAWKYVLQISDGRYTSVSGIKLSGMNGATIPDQPQNENQTTQQTGTVYVHGSSKIRSGPGLSYKEVSSAAAGKTLTWLGEVSIDDRGVAWYKILRNNGEAAWISSRYCELKTSDGSEPQVPFGKLMKGSKGDRVVELQTMLAELGYHTGSIDGDYGGGTEKSVKAFQEAYKEKAGLSVNGEVDEATWNAIVEALKPEEEEVQILEITSPDDDDVIKFFDGENIVIEWTPCKDADYYEVTITDVSLTARTAQNINKKEGGSKGGAAKNTANKAGDSLVIYQKKVPAGDELKVSVSRDEFQSYYTVDEAHEFEIRVRAYREQ